MRGWKEKEFAIFCVCQLWTQEGYNFFNVPSLICDLVSKTSENYDFNGNPVIKGLKRISKPGCRVYVNSDSIPRVLNGMGTAVLTTSKGIISDKKARLMKVGGEVLCKVF